MVWKYKKDEERNRFIGFERKKKLEGLLNDIVRSFILSVSFVGNIDLNIFSVAMLHTLANVTRYFKFRFRAVVALIRILRSFYDGVIVAQLNLLLFDGF